MQALRVSPPAILVNDAHAVAGSCNFQSLLIMLRQIAAAAIGKGLSIPAKSLRQKATCIFEQ
jgi:hypothetical protein